MTLRVPNRAGIYCRLSYAPDGSLEKVERQEADCRALADRLVWPVSDDHVYQDNSRSAWQRDRKRPAWDRMLADIEAGKIDGIIVYHGDRLIRQPWDLELLLKLADTRRLPLASVSGVRDLNNEDDRFILRIEAAQACKASADTSRRVRRGWEARAKKGHPSGGGKRPFGFEADGMTRRESEAKILTEVVERYLAGHTQYSILRWLRSVSKTSQGNVWSARALRHMLDAPRIAGLVRHGDDMYVATWDPILPVTEPENATDADRLAARLAAFEDLQLLRRQRAAGHPEQGYERKYLLSGIAECVTCGGPMRSRRSGGRNRRTSRLYFCMDVECPKRMTRNVEHLDRYVEGHVLRLLSDPTIRAKLTDEASPSVAPQIAALQRRKAEAKEQLEALADYPEVSAASLVKALASFDQKIKELRQRSETSTRRRLLTKYVGITREEWDEIPIDLQAELVRALVRVEVLPATWRGPGFDTASVRITDIPLDDAE